jgi:hypothetical protein
MNSCEKPSGCGPVSATTEAATAPLNEGAWISSAQNGLLFRRTNDSARAEWLS